MADVGLSERRGEEKEMRSLMAEGSLVKDNLEEEEEGDGEEEEEVY